MSDAIKSLPPIGAGMFSEDERLYFLIHCVNTLLSPISKDSSPTLKEDFINKAIPSLGKRFSTEDPIIIEKLEKVFRLAANRKNLRKLSFTWGPEATLETGIDTFISSLEDDSKLRGKPLDFGDLNWKHNPPTTGMDKGILKPMIGKQKDKL